MSNRLKVFLGLFVAACVALGVAGYFVSEAKAQGTLTDPGSYTNTLQALKDATSVWSIVYEDQSDYPSPHQRHGTIVRHYHFSNLGGAVGNISLEPPVWTNGIPDNTIVRGGFVQVVEAITPATSTNTLFINTDGDILAEGTTLNAVGIKNLTLNGLAQYVASNSVSVVSNTSLKLAVEGSAATAGVFMVVLDVYYGQ